MAKLLIELDEDDWKQICVIMRTVTWGRDISKNWTTLRRSIEKKTMIRVEANDLVSDADFLKGNPHGT